MYEKRGIDADDDVPIIGCLRGCAECENIYSPKIHGVIRGKYEYQPEDQAGRFEVRNAQISIEDTITKYVGYIRRNRSF